MTAFSSGWRLRRRPQSSYGGSAPRLVLGFLAAANVAFTDRGSTRPRPGAGGRVLHGGGATAASGIASRCGGRVHRDRGREPGSLPRRLGVLEPRDLGWRLGGREQRAHTPGTSGRALTAGRRRRARADRPRAARHGHAQRQRDGRPGRRRKRRLRRAARPGARGAAGDRGDGPARARRAAPAARRACAEDDVGRATTLSLACGGSTTSSAPVRATGLGRRADREGTPRPPPAGARALRVPDRAGGADQLLKHARASPGERSGALRRRTRSSSRSPTTASAPARSRGGRGLVGMRERAALFGGDARGGRAARRRLRRARADAAGGVVIKRPAGRRPGARPIRVPHDPRGEGRVRRHRRGRDGGRRSSSRASDEPRRDPDGRPHAGHGRRRGDASASSARARPRASSS